MKSAVTVKLGLKNVELTFWHQPLAFGPGVCPPAQCGYRFDTWRKSAAELISSGRLHADGCGVMTEAEGLHICQM